MSSCHAEGNDDYSNSAALLQVKAGVSTAHRIPEREDGKDDDTEEISVDEEEPAEVEMEAVEEHHEKDVDMDMGENERNMMEMEPVEEMEWRNITEADEESTEENSLLATEEVQEEMEDAKEPGKCSCFQSRGEGEWCFSMVEVPGHGWCQDKTGREGTARTFRSLRHYSCDDWKRWCLIPDSKCAAVACGSTQVVLYTTKHGVCSKDCGQTHWYRARGGAALGSTAREVVRAGWCCGQTQWSRAKCYRNALGGCYRRTRNGAVAHYLR